VKYLKLGASRLEVSRIALGTMNFGRFTGRADAQTIMSDAHSMGVNFFDSSNSYGRAGDPLHPEAIIGHWFAGAPGRRARTVLATKLFEATDPWPNNAGLSALNIRRACEASLRRLGTDYIDLLQMHHVDREAGWPEIWDAFDILRQEGKVLYVGSSNFAGWHLVKAQQEARSRHRLGLVSEQSVYSLAAREIEREVLPAARDCGIGLLPWSPLGGGLLAGAPSGGVGRRAGNDPPEAQQLVLKRFGEVADAVGVTPAVLALAWLLHQPGVTAPIVGPRTPEQWLSTGGVGDVRLDAAVLDELDDIWPGPLTHVEQPSRRASQPGQPGAVQPAAVAQASARGSASSNHGSFASA
jgi:NDP-hexose 2,3-enoyl reductase